MAKLYYSGNPIEKKEHVKRRKWGYRLKKAALFISLAINVAFLAYVIIITG
jgi:hypothetical protein